MNRINIKVSSKKTPSNKSNHRHQKSGDDSDKIIIFGKYPTFLALKNQRRQISQIFVTNNTIEELKEFLHENKIARFSSLIKLTDNNFLENLVGKNSPHQGFAVKASRLPIKNQFQLLEELNKIDDQEKLPTLLLLDQISDPQNIGAIIRSAVAFGVKKIIFCDHHSPKESSAIVKASAGNIEYADLVVVTNFNNLMDKLKKLQYWCIGLAGEGKSVLKDIKGYKNIALVVGSEGDGIRDLVKKNCDLLLSLKTERNVESLNVSVATAIALNEIYSLKNV